ncbi:hypothetical protein BAE44_0008193 [Dichanthelium oligosanthes]|uniref:Uncharacterized protein n=1 Tax=Dichanthelium oligosanthes TaxID=888268 RepID=A0A1E5W0D8_9POAL|nr:hypothetical protein BAE44_0008193 [Dichanthelium oligosanthes]
MSAVVAQMRRAIGEEGANVTLARNLLAPVASNLSAAAGWGDAPDLHRRCVLFDCARSSSRARVDDVCAALAPSGAIEAVALCEHMAAAVVVFRTAAGAQSALRGPARGSCHEVLPLELGAEMPVIRPTDVKIMPDSRIPTTWSPGCATPVAGGGACTPQPPPEPEGTAWNESLGTPVAGGACTPRGTKRFRPSSEVMWMQRRTQD